MTPDTLLRTADPLRADDHDLDPRGEMGRRVRAAALRGGGAVGGAPAEAPAPVKPRAWSAPRAWIAPRAGRLALAGGAAIALAVLAVAVGIPGGGSSPTAPADARAALVSAAEKAAAFTSGRITWRVTQEDPGARAPVDTVTTLRFEGDDLDATSTSTVLPGRQLGYRRAGGRTWLLRDGRWEPFANRAEAVAGPAAQFARQLEAGAELARVARSADGVTATADGDGGATRYAATVDAAAVPSGFFDLGTTGPVGLTATVGADGVVRSVALRGGGYVVDVAFAALGAPQGIVAP